MITLIAFYASFAFHSFIRVADHHICLRRAIAAGIHCRLLPTMMFDVSPAAQLRALRQRHIFLLLSFFFSFLPHIIIICFHLYATAFDGVLYFTPLFLLPRDVAPTTPTTCLRHAIRRPPHATPPPAVARHAKYARRRRPPPLMRCAPHTELAHAIFPAFRCIRIWKHALCARSKHAPTCARQLRERYAQLMLAPYALRHTHTQYA